MLKPKFRSRLVGRLGQAPDLGDLYKYYASYITFPWTKDSGINSLFGVLVISVLETGLAQLGAQEPVKRLVTGGVIVAAVIVDFYRTRQVARRPAQ